MSNRQASNVKKATPNRAKLRKRTAALRNEIAKLDYVVSGTLLTRTMKCGKKNCRCANDPNARHGPYTEWNRREGGKLVHSFVSDEQAKYLKRALANQRRILELLKEWEKQSAKEILHPEGPQAS